MKEILAGSIDRIELMQTFIRIVESGSLSACARQLEVTQPTVSRRLQALEKMLGQKLILRTTHALKLTDDGERCYSRARQLVGNWYALEDELTNTHDEPVGTLRVRVPHAFGQDQMIEPLVDWLQKSPALNVEWMLNDRTPDFVAENIDCAIQVGALNDPGLVAIQIAEVPRRIVATPELLNRSAPLQSLEQLAALPWLSLSTFYRTEITLKHQPDGQSKTITISPRLSSDSIYAIRKAALAGMGVGLVSSWLVEEDLAAGRLLEPLPEWQAPPLPVWLTYPWASYYPARLRHFFSLIKQVMPTLTGTRPAAR
ncbi:LysR family transcriptional regulator [Tatumella citrea]|uniref:LysR family transcriptional regulator n=1 Tax=Tatumella citrea TaxID=53336 RepID=A0A1Y0LP36_TATCI|nr:LysR family transcriptional regulator [Tatumella citrea]ARU95716.1 LysR family transcriptional regulator [Tatumella citrea]ARU99756.1 LysR family transcriptional regulator [Tatumella citrea]